MKRMFILLLAALFLAAAGGAALAVEEIVMCPPSDPSCPPAPNFDTVNVHWETVPFTTIEICETDISVCTYIGCTEWCNRSRPFNYWAAATGVGLRKIVGKIDTTLPTDVSLHANLTRPDAIGTSLGWKELSTTNTDLVLGLEKLCPARGTGLVGLCAGPNAAKGSGTAVLTLTILDQI